MLACVFNTGLHPLQVNQSVAVATLLCISNPCALVDVRANTNPRVQVPKYEIQTPSHNYDSHEVYNPKQ